MANPTTTRTRIIYEKLDKIVKWKFTETNMPEPAEEIVLSYQGASGNALATPLDSFNDREFTLKSDAKMQWYDIVRIVKTR